MGGALARDLAVVRTVRDTVYEAVTQDSSTTSGNMTGLRDIGVTLTRDGNLSFDETTYDEIAASSFDDISMMLSAGTNNLVSIRRAISGPGDRRSFGARKT